MKIFIAGYGTDFSKHKGTERLTQLHMVGNLYQSSTSLGLDPVSSSLPRTVNLVVVHLKSSYKITFHLCKGILKSFPNVSKISVPHPDFLSCYENTLIDILDFKIDFKILFFEVIIDH